MDHCRRTNARNPAGAICLDFAKSFDSVNWQALDLVLQHWGFRCNFRRWITTFFRGTLVQVLVNSSRSNFFSLGAGVRQGDPLSPGLFVLFIEPLLCYLRALNDDMAIKIHGTSHHLLGFADDITGLVKDLHHAPHYLDRVNDFCTATGMRLNVDKTVLFPFHPWTDADRDLQFRLRDLGVRVLDQHEHTTLLGVAVGPDITPGLQLNHLLVRFQKLCVSWRWRARTLRGRVLLLKTMILSTLWHFLGAVSVPRKDLLQFIPLMRNFLNCAPSGAVHDPATRGQFSSVWFSLSSSDGGLDLPSVASSVELLHVNLIRQLIRHCRLDLSAPPKWFIPAQAAIDAAFKGQGAGMDFLYIPLSRLAQTSRWDDVPTYWRDSIATWSTKVLVKLHCLNPVMTKLTWPLWNNVFLRFTAAQRSLAVLHRKACGYLSHHDITRISSFCCIFGWIPDEATLREALAGSSIESARSMTAVVQKLAPRLAVPLHYRDFMIYPLPPATMVCALHVWAFDGHDIVYASNHNIKRLLATQAPPPLPLLQLSVPDVTLSPSHWAHERLLQRDVLPVYADFLFRLQHNGLGFRYKYRWLTTMVDCVYGCPTPETPFHLLWDCHTARHLWRLFLSPLTRLFRSVLGWDQVLFLHHLEVPVASRLIFGSRLPVRLFNIVRCVVLRTLWLNRNKALYDSPALPFFGVFRQCLTMIRLHFQRFYTKLTHSQSREFARHKLQLQAFRREWVRDFPDDPFSLFDD
ncbi:unnamed protein product [Peronospora effusa]|nr:unnamed protein product [Peronospora effusa]